MNNLPLHPDCRLLSQHPSGLLAVDKAAGVPSHPNNAQETGSAVLTVHYDREREYFRSGTGGWYLLNRLDAPTSGVLLLADREDVAQRVKAAFAEHQVHKSYLAVVKGVPRHGKEVWRDYLKTARMGGKLRTTVATGPANGITQMELLERAVLPPPRALLLLQPHTGKTHQLRVQCAHRHLPIVGDATYGDFSFNRHLFRQFPHKRLYLHCWKTSLRLKFGDGLLDFAAESPPPFEFKALLGHSA